MMLLFQVSLTAEIWFLQTKQGTLLTTYGLEAIELGQSMKQYREFGSILKQGYP